MKKLLISLVCLSLFCLPKISMAEELESAQVYKIDTGISNVYLLKAKKNILVDISENGQQNNIIENLKKLGLKPEDISLIILTHAHGDHAGGAKYFQDNFKIPVMMGKEDEHMALAGKNDELKPMYLFAAMVKPFIKNDYPAFTPDLLVEEEFDLEKYGIDGKVVKMGGHTPGSLVVILDHKRALVGDLIRGSMVYQNSPRVHFFHNDPDKAEANLKDLLNMRIRTFYPGHWGPLEAKDIRKMLNYTE
jgi:hydroxyacylglutathione hydrolase